MKSATQIIGNKILKLFSVSKKIKYSVPKNLVTCQTRQIAKVFIFLIQVSPALLRLHLFDQKTVKTVKYFCNLNGERTAFIHQGHVK